MLAASVEIKRGDHKKICSNSDQQRQKHKNALPEYSGLHILENLEVLILEKKKMWKNPEIFGTLKVWKSCFFLHCL